jgi:trimeric autotransporter adhesin
MHDKKNMPTRQLLILLAALALPSVAAAVTFSGNVQFRGNLSITGSLSKGSGAFAIDHPLKPRTHLLYHSFVESPDVKNIYDGIATLDKNGEADIELPSYFEALNRDFRYQFFPLDEAMPDLHIQGEISGNRFMLAGGKPHGRVSWQVTGIRHDPYIIANPIIVEVEKGPGEVAARGECIFEPLCKQP